MKTILLAILLALPALAQTITGLVVDAHDGDTVRLATGQRVRLWGIDCPELKQAYGRQARDHLRGLVLRRTVTLPTHGTDRYGRVLAVVVLDGRDVNADLLRAGLAWWYRKYSPEAKDYAAIEKAARNSRVGLWAQAIPLAPWDFRHPENRASK